MLVALAALAVLPLSAQPSRVHVLHATGALPAHVADAFRNAVAYEQADNGTDFIFDRGAHAVYTLSQGTLTKVVTIGAEPGRIIDPTAFALDPTDGAFVVADAPLRRQRIQIFDPDGARIGGFTLPDRQVARVIFDGIVMNGIGSLQFTGHSVLINQPETGALVSELDFYGRTRQAFGTLRLTGQEADRDVHLALNSGFPLVDPAGGFYFVFNTGVPLFRKYDAHGTLVFERHIEGPELDEYVRTLPTTWPKRNNGQGDELPFVPPAIRTAGVDRHGRLWVVLVQPYAYVYDARGEKIETVQFWGAGAMTPNSLFFTRDGRILVTPGCYEFKPTL